MVDLINTSRETRTHFSKQIIFYYILKGHGKKLDIQQNVKVECVWLPNEPILMPIHNIRILHL